MKKILIFAGTTEGRELSEHLAASGIAHSICVATEYGELVLKEHPLVQVHCGRMNQEEIREYIETGAFAAVVDATHPYADMVTENIKLTLQGGNIPYIRLKRELAGAGWNDGVGRSNDGVCYFASNEACAEALKEVEGNILLTTGSKELAVYCAAEDVKNRLYVRVLPGMESLELCMKQDIVGKQILALQGPFSVELNEAILRQYDIRCMVTKASGRIGGYQEKAEAAKRVGIPLYVIGHPGMDEGYSFEEVCRQLEEICEQKIPVAKPMNIVLAGIGMGSVDTMTREVRQAIEGADVLLGAQRMLEHATMGRNVNQIKKPYYLAEQIIPYLKEIQSGEGRDRNVVILFSGDSGFYSGCQKLYRALQEEIAGGTLNAVLRILPGISSVAYLAACIGESYQDAGIYSMHGKALTNFVQKVRQEKKLFLLMSGVKDVNRLGKMLLNAGIADCEVIVGFQLSYPNQQIKYMTPKECCEVTEEGLYICCIKNPSCSARILTHGKADSEFIRDKVPMTKEEVREVSICKLKLHENAVVYDVGSGTGSIAVEMAALSDTIQVIAIEQKPEAVALLSQNKEKFQLENIEIVSGSAPDVLENLPVPTHAFIGGSGGRMKSILAELYAKNPRMRVVINAISMETICEIKELLSVFSVEEEDVVQMQVSRSKTVGAYHLMQAENPVWICSFRFREK